MESLIEYIHLVNLGDDSIPARLAILQGEREVLEKRVEIAMKALDRLNHKINNYQNKVVPREHELFNENDPRSEVIDVLRNRNS